MNRRPFRQCLVASVLLLLIGGPAAAAGATSQEREGAPLAIAPEPVELAIPEGQILTRGDLDAADMRRIEALLRPVAELVAIETALPNREAEVLEMRSALDSIGVRKVSGRRLDGLRMPWIEMRRELDVWREVARRRFATLQDEREHLGELRDRWAATAAEVDIDELSPEMVRRVDELMGRVIDLEDRVRERRNAVGGALERLTGIEETTVDALQRLDEMAEATRGGLLSRTAEPIWRSLAMGDALPAAGDMEEVAGYWRGALSSYVALRSGRLAFLAALFAGLLVLAVRLWRRSREWSTGAGVADAAQALASRPVSVALAFTLASGVFVLPNPVGAATDVMLLLSLVTLIRVGTVVLPHTARHELYSVAVFVVLARISLLSIEGPMQRVLVLLVTALALAGTISIARRRRRLGPEEMPWHRVATTLITTAVLMLAVALVANVLGWVALAKLLTEATLASLFTAVGWAIFVTTATILLPVVLGGPIGRTLPSLRRDRAVITHNLVVALSIAAIFDWTRYTLTQFRVYEPVYGFLEGQVGNTLSFGGMTISLGGILGAILILVATNWIAQFVRFALREEVLPRLQLPRGGGQSVVAVVNYSVYIIGVVSAAGVAGLSGTQVTVVVGALSVGIGLGLQSIVNNFVSGLILIFERPIKAGDMVETTAHLGTVTRIGIRASTIRLVNGAEVIVPNADLVTKEVTNWTRSDDTRRIDVTVGVAYGTDPEKVLELLLGVAREHPGALSEPEPKAHMTGFGDSSLNFRLRVWAHIDDFVDVLSEVNIAINRALREAGITIPFPQRDVHLLPGDAAPDDVTGGQ